MEFERLFCKGGITNSKSTAKGFLSRFQKLDQCWVKSICSYKDLIITISSALYDIGGYKTQELGILVVWNAKGERLASQKFWHSIFSVIVWEESIVVCSQNVIEFWNIESWNNQVKITQSKSIKCWKTLLNIELWNDVLCGRIDISYSVPGLVTRYYIALWTTDGTYVSTKIPAGSMMKVHQEFLWICEDDQLCVWTKRKTRKEFSFEKVKTLQLPGMYHFGFWNNQLVAAMKAPSGIPNIYILNLDGELIFKMSTGPNEVVSGFSEWEGKLVCVTEENFLISIYHANGELFQIIGAPMNALLSNNNNRFWYATETALWFFKSNWKVERLLWLGWKKNEATTCNIATLPKDLILFLISLL